MTYQALAAVLATLTTVSCAGIPSSPVLADVGPGVAARLASGRSVASKANPLEIDVYPRIVTDDYASVRLRVEPNELSRHVDVSWWSEEGLGGSHLVQVDGERGAIRYEFPIKRIDPGEYDVTAVLTRSDGTRIRRTTTVRVMERLP